MKQEESIVKVGLEIHGYLNIENNAKLFCDNKIDPQAEPNTNVCPICTGQPGSKPMAPNSEALHRIIAISEMLNCRTNTRLLFQRKHYSWPDLPNGYQRTISGSYSTPVGVEGEFLGIGISDVHLEEDPARWDPETGTVDYNRSGLPLVEIVTEPDFHSAGEVREWLKKLMTTLSYIRAIDPEAGIKSDVNVSVAPDFNRVEIKNVNSFRSIVRVIEFEAKRQLEEIKEGKRLSMETRAWSEASGTTVFMRSKEEAMDYMFIPDPDLPAINIAQKLIKTISDGLPERPHEKILRYKKLGVDDTDAYVVSSEILLAELFEQIITEINPVLAAKWLRRELMRVANYNKLQLHELEVDARHLIQLLRLVETGKITENVAKKILEKLIRKPFDVEEYIKEKGLLVVSDKKQLETLCRKAIAGNPAAAANFKEGSKKALNFLIGKVMAETKGRADPGELNKIMVRLIENED